MCTTIPPCSRLIWIALLVSVSISLDGRALAEQGKDFTAVEQEFRQLPADARRLTGPLFWLHGDESREQLEACLEKVAEGGNGCFTAESRPHNDWLGPGWYRDLKICLEAAKRLDLQMWIFDERWWPSGEVAGKVPQQYGSKYMEAVAQQIEGPQQVQIAVPANETLIAVLAGEASDNGVDGGSLVDLTESVRDGRLKWAAPEGTWNVMTFTWSYSKGRRGRLLVDGASQAAVDWYINTVYQPHYDHFADEFGKTIRGYFYDEPETFGDWGTEVIPELKRRGVDWKRALVAWKFHLADQDEQVAAKYQYQDAFAESWGQTLYGGLTEWCHEHNVLSIGHWLEHNREYFDPRKCAGNMFQVQKYSDMGAIDAVFKQFIPGQKDNSTYQTPKLGSSISHAYGKVNDLAMVEIFGARGQDLSYPEMKWWTDHMHASGINFHIPHSFNPRGPYDRDCPPYFYNGGYEPRWPLYRVYADYTSRLSLLLTGGRHMCPVALLYLGNSVHVGQVTTPEDMTTALQDALFDCDWIPYEVFENDITITANRLHLRDERYKVLIVPAVEVIPYDTLAKAKAFFDAGGIVIGYGRLPSKSATLGRTADDITALRTAIWTGKAPKPSLEPCQVNTMRGRSYFLPEKPTSHQIQQVLTGDARIRPTLEVLEGETDDWLHVLHRVKNDRDIFFLSNLQHDGPKKHFHLRAHTHGTPEVWDPMRCEICSIAHQRVADDQVELSLTLEPLGSVLLVFQPTARRLPPWLDADTRSFAEPIEVKRTLVTAKNMVPSLPKPSESLLDSCPWVWYPGDPQNVPPCTRYFRKTIEVPTKGAIVDATFRLSADNEFVLYVNGVKVGAGINWSRPETINLTGRLKLGSNVLAIEATNTTDKPSPAGLIGAYRIVVEGGKTISGRIDRSWQSAEHASTGWQNLEFDASSWKNAKEIAWYLDGPWGPIESNNKPLTLPPIKQADPFLGNVGIPTNWLTPGVRIYVETSDIPHEGAAAVTINGDYAGGFIGKPNRVDITSHVKVGQNTIQIEPFAPQSVRVHGYSDQE